jgi:cytochrome c peroxidase
VFQLFGPWSTAGGTRQAIARGEALFNERIFSGAFGSQPSTCSSCHNAPNAGSSSIGLMFNIGVSAEARRTPDLPLYTLRCTPTGHVVRTTDPGLALLSGRCADIGRFKVPTLRGLASRAPYFHDGSAATLEAVVEFYDRRFGIGLTADQQRDLAAFLRAL